MLKCVEGVYRNGEVELLESPPNVTESRVIVAFLEGPSSGPSLSPEELAELRGKLAAWEDDWNATGMEAYDAL